MNSEKKKKSKNAVTMPADSTRLNSDKNEMKEHLELYELIKKREKYSATVDFNTILSEVKTKE
jgi:hypothetical protein